MEVTKLIIDIFGAGAIGLLFYSKLVSHHSKATIHLWTRTIEQASIINTQGISVEISTIHHTTAPEICIPSILHSAYAIDEIDRQQDQPKADYILVTVKQKDLTAELINRIQQRTGNHTRIICLQNGIRTESIWKAPWQVYAAITTEGAKRLSMNQVVHTGVGETIIGNINTSSSSRVGKGESKEVDPSEQQIMQLLLNELQKAGFNTTLSNDIDRAIYRKLMINAVINPLTAIWRIRNGELLESNQRIAVMQQLYDEVIKVYQANGIEIVSTWWEDLLQVCQSTATNTSSMLADVLQGKSTEIQWINGSIVQMGQKYNIPTPGHYWVYTLIEAINRQEDK